MGLRYIRHELTWEPTALISYTAPITNTTFEIHLILNDSTDSKFGPGIWLDMATTTYNSDLPANYADWYTPWHSLYEKHFIGGSTAPQQLQPNRLYYLQYTSDKPGQATQDNAELSITYSREQCWILCTSGDYCNIHESRFGLEPIPGRIAWQPAPARCFTWQDLFLPWIVGR